MKQPIYFKANQKIQIWKMIFSFLNIKIFVGFSMNDQSINCMIYFIK